MDQIFLIATGNITGVAYINKAGGMKLCPLCALLWRILTWCSRKRATFKARHIPGCLNVIANYPGLARPPRGFSVDTHEVAPASSRPVHNEVQQQVTPVCVTSSRPPTMSSGCIQPVLRGSRTLCLPASSHLGQSGGQVALSVQENHSACSRVAQYAQVLGCSGHVEPNLTVPDKPTQSADPAVQAPRASSIKEQGFSEAVAA